MILYEGTESRETASATNCTTGTVKTDSLVQACPCAHAVRILNGSNACLEIPGRTVRIQTVAVQDTPSRSVAQSTAMTME
jgi:hypothetical protein